MTSGHKEILPHLELFKNDIAGDLATYPEYTTSESYAHPSGASTCLEFSVHKPLLLPPAELIDATPGYEPDMEGYESGFALYIHFPEEKCAAPLLLDAILNYQHSAIMPRSNWGKVGGEPSPRLMHTTAEARCSLRRSSTAVEMDFRSWQTYCPRQLRGPRWSKAGNYKTDDDSFRENIDPKILTGLFGIIKMQIGLSLHKFEETQ